MFAELGEVPAGAAKDLDLGAGLGCVCDVAGGGLDGVELAVHGADEGGFAAAVGPEDDEVFAGLDGEIDVVEDDAVSGGYGDVAEVEEGRFSALVFWGAGCGRDRGRGGHLC